MPQKSLFICSHCDAQFKKWTGRCLECGQWSTVHEATPILPTAPTRMEQLSAHAPLETTSLAHTDHGPITMTRTATGIAEFDRVLGGGFVPGSLVLLAGEPGIGKSTLALQLAGAMPSTLYISGEESAAQVSLRANRLGVQGPHIKLVSSQQTERAIATMIAEKPALMIIDSAQTLRSSEVSGEPGSPSQVRASASLLMEAAKQTNSTIMLIGHVTKDGTVAGPKTLEHLVDVVLNFEGDRQQDLRLVRSPKNRFGSTSEVGLFTMAEAGLREVSNPSEHLLEERGAHVAGSLLTCLLEGTRPVLIEIQALVNQTSFGYPVRKASGFDLNRLHVLIAVLERRAGLNLQMMDVHINVVGGIKANEPAADLAVCLAVASALKDTAVGADVVAFGEVGLGGEVRHVKQAEARLKECAALGMQTVYVGGKKAKTPKDMNVKQVKTIAELIAPMQ